MPVRIGVNVRFKNPTRWQVDWGQSYREHVRYAQAIERFGFDGIWVPEHHCVPSGYNPTPFVTLAAIAQATERCTIGTQPLLLPLHNPVMVAEQAAAIDALSGGRMVLGVGAGYRDGDFACLGLSKAERGARTEEGLAVLLRALAEPGPFDHDGRFYKLRDVAVTPRPVGASGLPVQLAARSPAAARRAVRYGLDVNTQNRFAAAEVAPILVAEMEKAGRDPAQLGVSVLGLGFLAESRQSARDLCLPYMEWDYREFDAWQNPDDPDDRRMIEQRKTASEVPLGALTADDLVAEIHASIDAIAGQGLRPDWVNLSLWPPGMPFEQAIDCLERVAAEVLPQVPRRQSAEEMA
jgi:alkanesulfonate monooxygenase SsuD/methylene tetrahydromethanopterin reductase-like flavin-dependent oxidoreductase (luciferase family)